MEGQRHGPYQPRSKRGTSDGLGMSSEMAQGLKARSNGPAHGGKWSRAFSPWDVRARKPWALPKAGMKPGPWPSIATPASKLRPAKIRPAQSRSSNKPRKARLPLWTGFPRFAGLTARASRQAAKAQSPTQRICNTSKGQIPVAAQRTRRIIATKFPPPCTQEPTI